MCRLVCRGKPCSILTNVSADGSRFDVYPYDDLMYEPNREYVGYSMPKLARSKHDRITGTCVARFDHYCAWLTQTVFNDTTPHRRSSMDSSSPTTRWREWFSNT